MSVIDCVQWHKLEQNQYQIKGAPPPYISRQMDPNNESLGEWALLFRPLFHWPWLSADPDCLNLKDITEGSSITHSQTVKEEWEIALYEVTWTCKWLYQPVFALFLADKDSQHPSLPLNKEETRQEKTRRNQECSKRSPVCFLGERNRPMKMSSLVKWLKKSGLLSVIRVSHRASYSVNITACIQCYWFKQAYCGGYASVFILTTLIGHYCLILRNGDKEGHRQYGWN